MYIGCAVLLCLVCLLDLACFFLSSFSSLIKSMYMSLSRVCLSCCVLHSVTRAVSPQPGLQEEDTSHEPHGSVSPSLSLSLSLSLFLPPPSFTLGLSPSLFPFLPLSLPLPLSLGLSPSLFSSLFNLSMCVCCPVSCLQCPV